jgi:hypothetical protein
VGEEEEEEEEGGDIGEAAPYVSVHVLLHRASTDTGFKGHLH